jgi:hypothetical protein
MIRSAAQSRLRILIIARRHGSIRLCDQEITLNV